MRFEETDLQGAWLVTAEPIGDERGFFARTFCVEEFAAQGIETVFVQHSISHSIQRHTLRGLHFQRAPNAETKLVSCIRGAVYDVIVDLRPHSVTYRRWQGFELRPENARQLYIPEGFAHGFQTLADDSVVAYLISEYHVPTAACGLPYNDPAIAIDWPAEPSVMSARDRQWPRLELAVEI